MNEKAGFSFHAIPNMRAPSVGMFFICFKRSFSQWRMGSFNRIEPAGLNQKHVCFTTSFHFGPNSHSLALLPSRLRDHSNTHSLIFSLPHTLNHPTAHFFADQVSKTINQPIKQSISHSPDHFHTNSLCHSISNSEIDRRHTYPSFITLDI